MNKYDQSEYQNRQQYQQDQWQYSEYQQGQGYGQGRFKNSAPISPIKSPDLDVIPGHNCRKRGKGETPFFSTSEKRYGCLDFGPEGTQTLKSYLNPDKSGEIKTLKDRFLNQGKISSDISLKDKIIERFEVVVKNREIASIRRVVNPDGSKITAKFGGRYVPKSELSGYSLKIMGLDGKPDGTYEV